MNAFTAYGMDLIRRCREVGITFTKGGDGSLLVEGYLTPNLAELIQLNERRILAALDSGVEVIDLATERMRRRPQRFNSGGAA